LIGLIRLRNDHPAFSGDFSLLPSDDRTLALRWTRGGHFAELRVEFEGARHRLDYSAVDGLGVITIADGGDLA
jgi:sucrose phosphorylase